MLSPRMPDLSALEVLVTVAGAGSFNGAAGLLGVSQQAVSARIAAIERQSGVTLVERTPRGSTLTPTGVVVAAWAARLLALADEMDSGLAALRSDAQTTLRIAASFTVAEYLLPAWLVALQVSRGRRHQSPVAVELTVTNSTAVAADVGAGAVDIGFVEGPVPPRGLRHRIVGHDRLLVVIAPTHPWAKWRDSITAEELARTPLVVREHGSGTREALAVAIKKAGGASVELVAPALSLPTTATVRASVLAGAGPAVLSELAVADDLTAGRLLVVPIGGLDLRRDLRAVWRGPPQLAAGAARDLLDIAGISANPR
jgi:DNA-binding transcriptional LysR family regulator